MSWQLEKSCGKVSVSLSWFSVIHDGLIGLRPIPIKRLKMVSRNLELAEPQLSEGEKFIEEFFIDCSIKYECQKIITLTDDSKAYRIADFYLPKYRIYVEFFGKWNVSDEEKARYREKKAVYFRNRVPCIYLYPENLGIIEHVFHYRIRRSLRDHGMHRELRKYLFHDFNLQHGGLLIAIVLITFITVLFILKATFQGPQTVEDFLVGMWIMTVVLLGGHYALALMKFFGARKGR